MSGGKAATERWSISSTLPPCKAAALTREGSKFNSATPACHSGCMDVNSNRADIANRRVPGGTTIQLAAKACCCLAAQPSLTPNGEARISSTLNRMRVLAPSGKCRTRSLNPARPGAAGKSTGKKRAKANAKRRRLMVTAFTAIAAK